MRINAGVKKYNLSDGSVFYRVVEIVGFHNGQDLTIQWQEMFSTSEAAYAAIREKQNSLA